MTEKQTSPSRADAVARADIERALTRTQHVLTLVFGLVLPAVCLLFDPVVFRTGLLGPALPRYALWGPVFGWLGLGALLFWLTTERAPAWCAGALGLAALGALGIGVLLMPLSIVGIGFMGLGLLGLVPFGTALVYGVHARGAWRRARDSGRPRPARLVAAAFGAALLGAPLAVPPVAEVEVRLARRWLATEDVAAHDRARQLLTQAHALGCDDSIVINWYHCDDDAASERMEAIYSELTGGSISSRASRLFD